MNPELSKYRDIETNCIIYKLRIPNIWLLKTGKKLYKFKMLWWIFKLLFLAKERNE